MSPYYLKPQYVVEVAFAIAIGYQVFSKNETRLLKWRVGPALHLSHKLTAKA